MKRVVVAMSGGVDSSVAASLLKDKGYEVIGVTMRLWPEELCGLHGQRSCCSLESIEDARAVANRLGIPYYVLNVKDEFKREVIDYFCSEYSRGRTPNPCIVCNNKIKFSTLLEKAKDLGADYVATGHYASLDYDAVSGRYFIKEGKDKTKDQSYVLFNLTQGQLKYMLLPLGELTKKEVRELARAKDLRISEKPESQEICFVLNGDYRDFIKDRLRDIAPGKIIDTEGRNLGEHRGIAFYTVGQRKGLGIAAGRPLYIIQIDAEKNSILVGEEEDVRKKELIASEISWMAVDSMKGAMRNGSGRNGPLRARAKIRYNHKKADCQIIPVSDGEVEVIFDEPQHAITPGQAVVFYEGEKILGGGWIR